MQLTAADVAVLSSLPALVGLGLIKAPAEDQAQWDDGLAQLKADFSAQGRSVNVV